MNGVPREDDMYNPLLQALRELGGSGTIDGHCRVPRLVNSIVQGAAALRAVEFIK